MYGKISDITRDVIYREKEYIGPFDGKMKFGYQNFSISHNMKNLNVQMMDVFGTVLNVDEHDSFKNENLIIITYGNNYSNDDNKFLEEPGKRMSHTPYETRHVTSINLKEDKYLRRHNDGIWKLKIDGDQIKNYPLFIPEINMVMFTEAYSEEAIHPASRQYHEKLAHELSSGMLGDHTLSPFIFSAVLREDLHTKLKEKGIDNIYTHVGDKYLQIPITPIRLVGDMFSEEQPLSDDEFKSIVLKNLENEDDDLKYAETEALFSNFLNYVHVSPLRADIPLPTNEIVNVPICAKNYIYLSINDASFNSRKTIFVPLYYYYGLMRKDPDKVFILDDIPFSFEEDYLRKYIAKKEKRKHVERERIREVGRLADTMESVSSERNRLQDELDDLKTENKNNVDMLKVSRNKVKKLETALKDAREITKEQVELEYTDRLREHKEKIRKLESEVSLLKMNVDRQISEDKLEMSRNKVYESKQKVKMSEHRVKESKRTTVKTFLAVAASLISLAGAVFGFIKIVMKPSKRFVAA